MKSSKPSIEGEKIRLQQDGTHRMTIPEKCTCIHVRSILKDTTMVYYRHTKID